MELRSKVEEEFQKRMRSKEEYLPRKDVISLLIRLGLEKTEAESFLDSWEPNGDTKVSYKEFLDFIYGPTMESDAACVGNTTGKSDGVVDKADQKPQKVIEKSDLKASDSAQPDVLERKLTGSTMALDSTVGHESCPMTPSQTLTGPISDAVAKLDPVQEALESEAQKTKVEALGPDVVADAPQQEEEVLQGEPAPETPETEVNPSPEGADTTLCQVIEEAPPPPPKQKAPAKRCSSCNRKGQLFQDPNDSEWYCESCWADYNGSSPNGHKPFSLKVVQVVAERNWTQSTLTEQWAQNPIYGWPPYASPTPAVPNAGATFSPEQQNTGEVWATVKVRVVPDLVGPHARECSRNDRPDTKEVLASRYIIESVCGTGHFTRALMATDTTTGKRVCIKRHNGLTIELLTDLLAIGQRLEKVDPLGDNFPRLFDCFYDMSGYTVESLIEGKNCLEIAKADRSHFQKMSNLQIVARGAVAGLALLAKARVVHADVKPDNIMWTQPKKQRMPVCKLVDFGCARLDRRIENGRNWALNEGGAGHLGKWTPEMVLRLPITCATDVWGLAVSLLEIHSGRALWSCEADTVEIILAQVLGLTNSRDGLPVDLLRRSPLDITKLYSPHPQYFPVRRIGKGHDAPMEELRPATWGLGNVLGDEEDWDEQKKDFASYVLSSMTLDHEERPAASELKNHPFVAEPPPEPKEPKDSKAAAPTESHSKVVDEATAKVPAESKGRSEACPEERPED